MPLTNQKTYSETVGKKRASEVVQPTIVYEESSGFLTNRQIELYLVQHKMMREFLSKKKLVDEFNEFQQKKQHASTGVYAEWYKKWN